MLNRLLIGAAGLVAGTLVATPAVLGLSGNSSFSRDIQVPVPSGAHRVHFVEPGDDRSRSAEPSRSAEDRPGHDDLSSDATDDHGGLRGPGGSDDGPTHDAGDDHGGRTGGDDNSGPGSGGSSSTDNSGPGGGDDDNSGPGGGDDDNSGPGGGDDSSGTDDGSRHGGRG